MTHAEFEVTRGRHKPAHSLNSNGGCMFAIGNDLYWGKEDHDSPKPVIFLRDDGAFVITKNGKRKLSYEEFEALTGVDYFDFQSLELDSFPCVARHLGRLLHGEDTEFGDHRLYWKW